MKPAATQPSLKAGAAGSASFTRYQPWPSVRTGPSSTTSLLPLGSRVSTLCLVPGAARTRSPLALVATRAPAVKVGTASGPGVGASVAVAGGRDVGGWEL